MSPGILLVEGDPELARELDEQLQDSGLEVAAVAGDGETGCRLRRRLEPELVVMELILPDMDGIQAAREMTRGAPLPVVLLTSPAHRHLLAGAHQAGVYSYLIKPVDPGVLGPALELARRNFRRMEGWRRRIGDLRRALEQRRHLEKARGLLMARLGLEPGPARVMIQEEVAASGCSPVEAVSRILDRAGRD